VSPAQVAACWNGQRGQGRRREILCNRCGVRLFMAPFSSVGASAKPGALHYSNARGNETLTSVVFVASKTERPTLPFWASINNRAE
jgi:hypothetical protein